MRYLVLLFYFVSSVCFGQSANYKDNSLSISEVTVPFSPGIVHDVQFKLAEDGRWDLLNYLNGSAGVREVRYGVSGNFCSGYCSTHLEITQGALLLTRSAAFSDDGQTLPTISANALNTEESWNSLVKLIDFSSFEQLPDRLGCPGCADGPIYFIEIYYEQKYKRIEFGNEIDVVEIKAFYEKLKAISDEQTIKFNQALEKL
ncbi:MAG: hypothetical protein DU489_03555 [Nitrosomonas sp.]|uniref:hypothetical protein n=1 Tax=Nitrosomonas sp. TaxID=42353 RepID=UPI0032EDEDEE